MSFVEFECSFAASVQSLLDSLTSSPLAILAAAAAAVAIAVAAIVVADAAAEPEFAYLYAP